MMELLLRRQRLVVSTMTTMLPSMTTKKMRIHKLSLQQHRCINLLHKSVTSSNNTDSSISLIKDLDHALGNVRQYDPAGYLPGRLLPTPTMQLAYYSVRNFWIETGHYRSNIKNDDDDDDKSSSSTTTTTMAPSEHLDWWQQGMDQYVFADADKHADNNSHKKYSHHPSLRLLQHLVHQEHVPWKPESFHAILQGRRQDLSVKQYESMQDLISNAEQSCSALFQLVLVSGDLSPVHHPIAFEAARRAGICHGLTNALRQSIPIVSTTGKLIIPRDLCLKYDIATPRYLLSALAQGDIKGTQAMQAAVQDISATARHYLAKARELRPEILTEVKDSGTAHRALAVLIPVLASETFLNRLASSTINFQLTNRNLRSVSWWEHGQCAARMMGAYITKTF